MTETGQVPGEGQPENGSGRPEQPATGAYTFGVPADEAADSPVDDDDLLLMPGSPSAWGDPAVVTPQPPVNTPANGPDQASGPAAPAPGSPAVPRAADAPRPADAPGQGNHRTGGGDPGSFGHGAVRTPPAPPPTGQAGAVRRPLHLGPLVPEQSGAVRSLADRGPNPTPSTGPVRQPGPPPQGGPGPDYAPHGHEGSPASAAPEVPGAQHGRHGEPGLPARGAASEGGAASRAPGFPEAPAGAAEAAASADAAPAGSAPPAGHASPAGPWPSQFPQQPQQADAWAPEPQASPPAETVDRAAQPPAPGHGPDPAAAHMAREQSTPAPAPEAAPMTPGTAADETGTPAARAGDSGSASAATGRRPLPPPDAPLAEGAASAQGAPPAEGALPAEASAAGSHAGAHAGPRRQGGARPAGNVATDNVPSSPADAHGTASPRIATPAHGTASPRIATPAHGTTSPRNATPDADATGHRAPSPAPDGVPHFTDQAPPNGALPADGRSAPGDHLRATGDAGSAVTMVGVVSGRPWAPAPGPQPAVNGAGADRQPRTDGPGTDDTGAAPAGAAPGGGSAPVAASGAETAPAAPAGGGTLPGRHASAGSGGPSGADAEQAVPASRPAQAADAPTGRAQPPGPLSGSGAFVALPQAGQVHRNEAAEEPRASDAPQASRAPAPEEHQDSGAPQVPQAAQGSEASARSEPRNAPRAADAPQAAEAPEAPEAPRAPEEPHAAKATEAWEEHRAPRTHPATAVQAQPAADVPQAPGTAAPQDHVPQPSTPHEHKDGASAVQVRDVADRQPAGEGRPGPAAPEGQSTAPGDSTVPDGSSVPGDSTASGASGDSGDSSPSEESTATTAPTAPRTLGTPAAAAGPSDAGEHGTDGSSPQQPRPGGEEEAQAEPKTVGRPVDETKGDDRDRGPDDAVASAPSVPAPRSGGGHVAVSPEGDPIATPAAATHGRRPAPKAAERATGAVDRAAGSPERAAASAGRRAQRTDRSGNAAGPSAEGPADPAGPCADGSADHAGPSVAGAGGTLEPSTDPAGPAGDTAGPSTGPVGPSVEEATNSAERATGPADRAAGSPVRVTASAGRGAQRTDGSGNPAGPSAEGSADPAGSSPDGSADRAGRPVAGAGRTLESSGDSAGPSAGPVGPSAEGSANPAEQATGSPGHATGPADRSAGSPGQPTASVGRGAQRTDGSVNPAGPSPEGPAERVTGYAARATGDADPSAGSSERATVSAGRGPQGTDRSVNCAGPSAEGPANRAEGPTNPAGGSADRAARPVAGAGPMPEPSTDPAGPSAEGSASPAGGPSTGRHRAGGPSAERHPTGGPSAEGHPTAGRATERQSAGEPAPPAGQPARRPAEPAGSGYNDSEREALHRVMRERRDIRNGFRQDPIPHEVLLRVLEAAHTAPSVGHSQPWDFVVIRSARTRQTVHELAARQREAYAKSLPKGRAKQFKELKVEAILDTPVNIVVTADPTRGGRHTLGRHSQPRMAPYSSALAVENLWLAARAEGLGVGWVSFFDERELVRALGLPDHLEVVAYLCVGYVDEFPDEPELMQAGWSKRRPLSWVVHEEEYGRRVLPGAEPHDSLAETLRGIRPLDAKALGEAWERQKRMTKPPGALGMLEIISAQLSGLSRKCPPPVPEPAAVAVFAGDHGVHAQGVTAWPQEVTGQMVANFLRGGAVCNAFANQVGAEVCVIDVGVAGELPSTPGLLPRKVRPGTADFTTGPAMTREEVVRAIEVGIETARDLVTAGNKALITGEMGIANTTASAALVSVFTGVDPAEVTGRGTGINDEMHARKVDVVRRALELHQPDAEDPIGVLAAVGGLEHAAMVGLILGGASLRTPVILDGVSAGAAALVARAIAPEALAACIAGHRSAEPGHVAALTKLGLRPLIDLDLRLGEGTGALLALPVVQSAARAMHEVATFDSAGVTEKT